MNRKNLPITEPCHADWTAMDGEEKTRFCGSCSKNVHDLSAMTEPEAKQLLETVEEPCVRYTCNPDGSIRFKPSRRVMLARAGMLAGGLLIGGLPAAASVLPQETTAEVCESKSLLDRLSEAFWSLFEEEPEPMMGEPAITPADTGVPDEPDTSAEPVETVEPVPLMGKPMIQREMRGGARYIPEPSDEE